jgi:AraC-like DNA-binding protein
MKIRWLFEADSEPTQISHSAETPMIRHIPRASDDIGHAINESARLDAGIYLFRSGFRFRSHEPKRVVQLADVEGSLPEPAFMVRVTETGSCLQYERMPDAVVASEPGLDLFRHAQEFHFLAAAHSTRHLDITSLCIYRSKLEELLGHELVPDLFSALGITEAPCICSLKMPRYLSVPLRQAMSSPYQGRLKLLAAQAKVLQYLSGLVSYVLKPGMDADLPQKGAAVEDLYNELILLEGKLPALDLLAQRYQVSTRTLNEKFKKAYGMPIVSFIVDHRLRAAHEALMHSNVAIKTIAARLGYSHVNHFSNAFTKKFGYPPGQLRSQVR